MIISDIPKRGNYGVWGNLDADRTRLQKRIYCPA